MLHFGQRLPPPPIGSLQQASQGIDKSTIVKHVAQKLLKAHVETTFQHSRDITESEGYTLFSSEGTKPTCLRVLDEHFIYLQLNGE
jgi:hypothetical protein